MYTYTHTHIRTHTHKHAPPTRTHTTHTYTRTETHTHTHKHSYTHTHSHTHTRPHTHTHTHTHRDRSVGKFLACSSLLRISADVTGGLPLDHWKTRSIRHPAEGPIEALCNVYHKEGGAKVYWARLPSKARRGRAVWRHTLGGQRELQTRPHQRRCSGAVASRRSGHREYIYVYMYICIYIYIYILVCIYVRMCKHIYLCIYLYVYTYIFLISTTGGFSSELVQLRTKHTCKCRVRSSRV